MLLPTSLVGSYPQPEWLIDREKLSKHVRGCGPTTIKRRPIGWSWRRIAA
jgi:hypothetical protein